MEETAATSLEEENVDLPPVGLDKEVEGGSDSSYRAYCNLFHAVGAAVAIDCDHSIHAAGGGHSLGHHADLGSHVRGLGYLVVEDEAEPAAEMRRLDQRWRGRRRKVYRLYSNLGGGRDFPQWRSKLRPSAISRLSDQTLIYFSKDSVLAYRHVKICGFNSISIFSCIFSRVCFNKN